MISLENLTSFYPTYSMLDEIVSSGGHTHLNIFIDVKGVLQSIYKDETMKAIVESSLQSKKFDTSIVINLLNLIIYVKKYALKRSITIDFFVFFEIGSSFYHESISPTYKYSRRIDNLHGLDRPHKEYLTNVLQSNYDLIDKIINKIPNAYSIRLQNFEADFVPYYLIRNEYVVSENSANIIFSSDHDLLQCLDLPGNNFVMRKIKANKRIVRRGNAVNEHLKCDEDYPDNYLTLFMSIIGDTGDDVDGIVGLGPGRTKDIINDVISYGGSIEQIRRNTLSGNKLFNVCRENIQNKNMIKVIDNESAIARNLKLVDFEIISRTLDDPSSTYVLNIRRHIEDTFNNKREYTSDIIITALNKTGMDVPPEINLLFLP